MRARAGCEFDYIQMQSLCKQALAMGGSAARAAGAGAPHAAAADGGSAAVAEGGRPEAAAPGTGGLQEPLEACRAPAPGGQAAAAVVEGTPSQFWLVPRPEAHVCSCSDFLDARAAGAAAPACRVGLARATLLTLTNEFSMDRQYLCDRAGRVFLRVGAGAAMCWLGSGFWGVPVRSHRGVSCA